VHKKKLEMEIKQIESNFTQKLNKQKEEAQKKEKTAIALALKKQGEEYKARMEF